MFLINDVVFSKKYGFGLVTNIFPEFYEKNGFPIQVTFSNGYKETYTVDGIIYLTYLYSDGNVTRICKLSEFYSPELLGSALCPK